MKRQRTVIFNRDDRAMRQLLAETEGMLGVYWIEREGRMLKVGLSENIAKRLRKHFTPGTHQWRHFVDAVLRDQRVVIRYEAYDPPRAGVRLVETSEIRKHRPLFEQVKPLYPEASFWRNGEEYAVEYQRVVRGLFAGTMKLVPVRKT